MTSNHETVAALQPLTDGQLAQVLFAIVAWLDIGVRHGDETTTCTDVLHQIARFAERHEGGRWQTP